MRVIKLSMKRILALLCLALLCPMPQAQAEPTQALDARVRSLSILSQRDEAIADIRYSNVDVRQAGCKPVSVANGIAAALGVTDREMAVGLVREVISLLVPERQRSKGAINLAAMNLLFDPVRREKRQGRSPNLEAALSGYEHLLLMPEKAGVQEVLSALDGASAPFLLAGRMSVYPSWDDMQRIAQCLHEQDMDEAMISLACLGAGRESHDAPLRLGKYGHYISILIPVGAFLEEGTVYVLDSMPRALEGEPYGGREVLRVPYAFLSDGPNDAFNQSFEAVRVSPTVIRLTLREEQQQTLRGVSKELYEVRRRALFAPFILSGTGMLLISLAQ